MQVLHAPSPGALIASPISIKPAGHAMNLRLMVDGVSVPASLYDNVPARDLAKLLPLELTLDDYAAAEKIAYLPRQLDTTGAPAGFKPSEGDIAYYAPWGNLAIFYRDQPFAEGLVSLGRIEFGMETLKASGKRTVAIEAIE